MPPLCGPPLTKLTADACRDTAALREKILLCSEPFTFVVHEYDDPADGAEFSLEGESAVRGAHRESWGDAGEAPAGLLSLDADGLANFILSDACRSIVVLDGAGMSTASGIPDYRGPTGLYSTLEPGRLTASAEEREKLRADPSFIAHIDLFRANPLPLLEVKRDFIRGVAAGRWLPTAGHHLLALLQRAGKLKRVFTQNIDGLHRVAGVDPGRLTEVHGTMSAARCSGCGAPMDMDTFAKEVSRRVRDIHAADSRDSSAPAESTAGGVPCPKECGEGSVKPAVVLFGQPIADSFSGDCAGDLPTADLLLVMGTSLTVPPVDTVPKLVGSKCMRVVVNGTRVGDRLGMVFDAPEARRDLLLKGNIDDVVVDLAGRLGWLDELGKRTETMAPNSAAVVCAALADRKARP